MTWQLGRLLLYLLSLTLAVILTVIIRDRLDDCRVVSIEVAKYEYMTLYDIDAFAVKDANSVPDAPSMKIDDRTTRAIVSEIVYSRGARLWKGNTLGLVQLSDGTRRIIAISHYGGFFKVIGQDGYYETVGTSRAALERCLQQAMNETFIPSRATRIAGSSTTGASTATRP
jgi:hypothetical protein